MALLLNSSHLLRCPNPVLVKITVRKDSCTGQLSFLHTKHHINKGSSRTETFVTGFGGQTQNQKSSFKWVESTIIFQIKTDKICWQTLMESVWSIKTVRSGLKFQPVVCCEANNVKSVKRMSFLFEFFIHVF